MRCASCSSEVALENVRFCPFCGAALAARPDERRNVVIAFADIAGFTALSQTLDPDELRVLMNDVMKRFTAEVIQRGGTVDKIIGDSIMFLFGVERAHADAHVRAIEALESFGSVLAEVNRRRKHSLSLHAGVSYGRVSVGAVGQSRTVMGDPVNLAARLMSVAAPGEIVVSKDFFELFGPDYRFTPLPAKELKGIAGTVSAYLYGGAEGWSAEEEPFVGRTRELSRLREALQRLTKGESGSSILVTGPAGIGKSRLLRMARSEFEAQSLRLISIYFEEGSRAFPAPFESAVRKLRGQLDVDAAGSAWELLATGDDFWKNGTPADLLELFKKLLLASARSLPTLVVLENLQYADVPSMEVLTGLLGRFRDSKVMIVGLSRSHSKGFAENLELPPLSSNESEVLFRRWAEIATNPIAECGGNPLILRELARAAARMKGGDKILSGNLELLLASILDALKEDEREFVKRCAIFGSRVPIFDLGAWLQQPAAEIEHRLRSTGLFHVLSDDEAALFQNDMLRRTAYERISLSDRRLWHREITSILDKAGRAADEIAFHAIRGNDAEEAMKWALRAAEGLSKLPKQDTALRYLTDAETRAKELNRNDELFRIYRTRFEIESRAWDLGRGSAELDRLSSAGGMESMRERWQFLRAQFLYERGKPDQASDLLEHIWAQSPKGLEDEISILRARILYALGKDREAVHHCMSWLHRSGTSPDVQGECWNVIGTIAMRSGFELHVALDARRKAERAFARAGNPLGVAKAQHNLGNALLAKGDYFSARDQYLKSGQVYLNVGDIAGYAKILMLLGNCNEQLLEFGFALGNYRQALDFLGPDLNPDLSFQLHAFNAGLLYSLGDLNAATAENTSAHEYFLKTRDTFFLPKTSRTSALLLFCKGKFHEALDLLEQAAQPTNLFHEQVELCILTAAEIAVRAGDSERARKYLVQHEERIRLKHRSTWGRLRRSRILSEIDSEENALKILEQAYASIPPDVELLERLSFLKEYSRVSNDAEIRQEFTDLRERILRAIPAHLASGFRNLQRL